MSTITRSPERIEFLTDLLTTAVDGGISYWATIVSYRWDCPPEQRHATVVEADDVAAEGEPEPARYRVTLDDLAAALGKIRRREVRLNDHLRQIIVDIDRTNNGETGELRGEDMDANTADIVFQTACFGSVVFS